MANGGGVGDGDGKGSDFYEVLGLKKECTEVELRSAYKKLAMRWHPDRCVASADGKAVDEAKKKFRTFRRPILVQGMGDFLNEMAAMMKQNKPDENGGESFESLQDLFQEMLQADLDVFSSSSTDKGMSSSTTSCSFSFGSYSETSNGNNKRNSTDFNFGPSGFDAHFQNFCVGVGGRSSQLDDRSKRRNSKQTRQ